jgi:hypothetical protein
MLSVDVDDFFEESQSPYHSICFIFRNQVISQIRCLQAYVSDFDDADDVLETMKDRPSGTAFQPIPPMYPPKPVTLSVSNRSSTHHVIAPAPTNASLARSRAR